MTDPGTGFDTAAWSWVDHLRHGGTTPWLAWLDASHPATGAGRPDVPHPGGPDLPGAAQLELLRRLNLGAASSGRPPLDPEVADLVLHRAGPGRGMAMLPLLWPPQPDLTASGLAAAPVDPATVPAGELLRVGAGVLADLVALLPHEPDETGDDGVHSATRPGHEPGHQPGHPARTWRPSRAFRRPSGRRSSFPSFRLEGPPLTVARVRSTLAALGVAEHEPRLSWLGGRRPASTPDAVLVLVEPVEDMLFEVWSHRAQRGSARQWRRFAEDWQGRGHLPPSAQLDRVAAGWAGRVGAQRVHLVAGPDPLLGVAEVLGLPNPADRADRADRAGTAAGAPAASGARTPFVELPAVLVDVLRRYNAVAALRLPEPDRQAALGRLSTVLERIRSADRPERPDRSERSDRSGARPGALTDSRTGPPRLGVPPHLRAWASATGARMAEDLRRGGYAVHGDPDVLARVAEGRPGTLRGTDVLAALLDVVLAVAEAADGRAGEDRAAGHGPDEDQEVRR